MSEHKMDPKIKARWVEALRSGKYKQAKSTLRTDDKKRHCCLGVLCELYCQSTKNAFPTTGSDLLADDVSRWAGIEGQFCDDPLIGDIGLSGYNDGKGYGFKRIAALIEKHL